MGCHFPTEANSAPQAPRLAGLDHILAGQGLPGQIPRQGPGRGTPSQFTPSAIPGPGPWEKVAGGGRSSDLSRDGTSHGLNRGHRATSRGLGIPQGVGGRRCHLHLLGAAEGSLGFPVPCQLFCYRDPPLGGVRIEQEIHLPLGWVGVSSGLPTSKARNPIPTLLKSLLSQISALVSHGAWGRLSLCLKTSEIKLKTHDGYGKADKKILNQTYQLKALL